MLYYQPKKNTHTLIEIYFDLKYKFCGFFFTIHTFKSPAYHKIPFYPIAVKMKRAHVVNMFKRPLKVHIIEQLHKILKTLITPV